MRRGLISWSPEEMPVSTLEARVSRLQQAMREHKLGAVLLHTSFAHPAAVHWLTNFTPYWSEALLVVLPQGTPVLLAALTQRVHPWIREVSHLGDVVTAPNLGASALSYLGEHTAPGARVGVVGLEALPWPTAQPLMSSTWGPQLTDVSELFGQLRQPADMAELRLAARAERMADATLQASQNIGGVQLHSVTVAIALFHQVSQHAAIAATQIQDARTFGHQTRDGFKVDVLTHVEAPLARVREIFSK